MCRSCFICHLSRSFKACPFPTHFHPPLCPCRCIEQSKKNYFFACLLWRDSQWGGGCRGEEWLHAGGSMYIVQRHQVELEGAPPWSFYPLEIEKCSAKLGQQCFVDTVLGSWFHLFKLLYLRIFDNSLGEWGNSWFLSQNGCQWPPGSMIPPQASVGWTWDPPRKKCKNRTKSKGQCPYVVISEKMSRPCYCSSPPC